MRRPLATALAIALALAASALGPAVSAAAAQGVLVAPTAVFVDARTRAASLMLVNPNPDRIEVEIAAGFGYPITDSLGNMGLHLVDAPDSTMPSAMAWTRVYPKRMTIEPNAQQTVRLQIVPPPGIPDGEYWARLMITARGAKLPVTQATDSGTVKVGLAIEVRTIIPLLYRKGPVTSGAALAALRAERQGDSLVVRTRLERRGTGALLATVRGELIDTTGKVRASFHTPISAYYPIEPRFTAPVDALPPGRYRLRLEVAPGRADLPAESTLPFRAVRDSVTVLLP